MVYSSIIAATEEYISAAQITGITATAEVNKHHSNNKCTITGRTQSSFRLLYVIQVPGLHELIQS